MNFENFYLAETVIFFQNIKILVVESIFEYWCLVTTNKGWRMDIGWSVPVVRWQIWWHQEGPISKYEFELQKVEFLEIYFTSWALQFCFSANKSMVAFELMIKFLHFYIHNFVKLSPPASSLNWFVSVFRILNFTLLSWTF